MSETTKSGPKKNIYININNIYININREEGLD